MFWSSSYCMNLYVWPALLQLAQQKGLCLNYYYQPYYTLPPVTTPVSPLPFPTFPPVVTAPPGTGFPPVVTVPPPPGTFPPVVTVPPPGTFPPVVTVPPPGTFPPVVTVPPPGTFPPVVTVRPPGPPPATLPPFVTPPPGTFPPVVTVPPGGVVTNRPITFPPPGTFPPPVTFPTGTFPPGVTFPPGTFPPPVTVPPGTFPPVVTGAPTVTFPVGDPRRPPRLESLNGLFPTFSSFTTSNPFPSLTTNSLFYFGSTGLVSRPRPSSNRPSAFTFPVTSNGCLTPDRDDGFCENIRTCDALVELLDIASENPTAANYLRNSLCGFQGFDPMVCCPVGDKIPSFISAQSSPSQGYRLPTAEQDKCGFSNVTHYKVVGGTPAELGAWPWIAALGYLGYQSDSAVSWLCSGTLITTRHVITAAHCVYNQAGLTLARLGEKNLQSDNDGARPEDIRISDKIVHEAYDSKAFTSDIAMLKLERDVTVTLFIRPVCLPIQQDMRVMTFENLSPFVAGWGATEFVPGGGPPSADLQEVQLPVVPLNTCKENYASFQSQVIDERVLCAGFSQGGKDACQGDSGGPLMWPKMLDDRSSFNYYLIGVVSYGYQCARPGFPGVYTRITYFIPWIVDHLN